MISNGFYHKIRNGKAFDNTADNVFCSCPGIYSRMVEWNEENSRVSPGLLIEALVVCIMCGRKPLWKVEQFWADQDLALLFQGVDLTSYHQLNDDALGRALDKLAKVDMKALLSSASLALLSAHNLDISTIHLDTTTKSVQGAYENDSDGPFKIEYCYGKDHRMDLKKFKIGVAIQEQVCPFSQNCRVRKLLRSTSLKSSSLC